MNIPERELARSIGKAAEDCRRSGDGLHDEVDSLSEYGVLDVVLRNTVDSFNESVFVIITISEQAVMDNFGDSGRAPDDL